MMHITTALLATDMGVSENKGYLIGGPYNKDPTIGGIVLGSSISGNPHIDAELYLPATESPRWTPRGICNRRGPLGTKRRQQELTSNFSQQ